jgi:hypothetical protein
MSDFSQDLKQKIDSQKSIEDPVASLGGAKNHGDKLSLLEAILKEGKSLSSPMIGPQSIQTEASFSSSEMITHAVSHTRSAEVEVAKALSPEMRISLVERIIADRPDVSISQTKAVCEVLDIDSKPFVDSLIKDKVNQLQETIQEQKDLKQLRHITVSLLYEDRATTDAISAQFKEKTGSSLQTQIANQFKDPSTVFALDIALLGQQPTPALDLERVMALINFEKHQQKHFSGLFYTADQIHLAHAENAAKRALEFLNKVDTGEPDSKDTFFAQMKSATDSWESYVNSKGSFAANPSMFRGLLIFALLALSVLFIQTKDTQLYYWTGTILFSVITYLVGVKRQRVFHEDLTQILKNPFLTDSEKRAHKKSNIRKRFAV